MVELHSFDQFSHFDLLGGSCKMMPHNHHPNNGDQQNPATTSSNNGNGNFPMLSGSYLSGSHLLAPLGLHPMVVSNPGWNSTQQNVLPPGQRMLINPMQQHDPNASLLGWMPGPQYNVLHAGMYGQGGMAPARQLPDLSFPSAGPWNPLNDPLWMRQGSMDRMMPTNSLQLGNPLSNAQAPAYQNWQHGSPSSRVTSGQLYAQNQMELGHRSRSASEPAQLLAPLDEHSTSSRDSREPPRVHRGHERNNSGGAAFLRLLEQLDRDGVIRRMYGDVPEHLGGVCGWTVVDGMMSEWHRRCKAWFMDGKIGRPYKSNSFYQVLRRLGFFPTLRTSRGSHGYDFEGSSVFLWNADCKYDQRKRPAGGAAGDDRDKRRGSSSGGGAGAGAGGAGRPQGAGGRDQPDGGEGQREVKRRRPSDVGQQASGDMRDSGEDDTGSGSYGGGSSGMRGGSSSGGASPITYRPPPFRGAGPLGPESAVRVWQPPS